VTCALDNVRYDTGQPGLIRINAFAEHQYPEYAVTAKPLPHSDNGARIVEQAETGGRHVEESIL